MAQPVIIQVETESGATYTFTGPKMDGRVTFCRVGGTQLSRNVGVAVKLPDIIPGKPMLITDEERPEDNIRTTRVVRFHFLSWAR